MEDFENFEDIVETYMTKYKNDSSYFLDDYKKAVELNFTMDAELLPEWYDLFALREVAVRVGTFDKGGLGKELNSISSKFDDKVGTILNTDHDFFERLDALFLKIPANFLICEWWKRYKDTKAPNWATTAVYVDRSLTVPLLTAMTKPIV